LQLCTQLSAHLGRSWHEDWCDIPRKCSRHCSGLQPKEGCRLWKAVFGWLHLLVGNLCTAPSPEKRKARHRMATGYGPMPQPVQRPHLQTPRITHIETGHAASTVLILDIIWSYQCPVTVRLLPPGPGIAQPRSNNQEIQQP
jgi:hypothetical protein